MDFIFDLAGSRQAQKETTGKKTGRYMGLRGGKMDFNEWVEREGFEHSHGDFFICPGGHVWHEDDIRKLFDDRPEPDKDD